MVDELFVDDHFHVVFDVVECRHVFALCVDNIRFFRDVEIVSFAVENVFALGEVFRGENATERIADILAVNGCKRKIYGHFLSVLIRRRLRERNGDVSLFESERTALDCYFVIAVFKRHADCIFRFRVADRVCAIVMRSRGSAVEIAARHFVCKRRGVFTVNHARIGCFDGYGTFCDGKSAFLHGHDVIVGCSCGCDNVFRQARVVALRISAGVGKNDGVVSDKCAVFERELAVCKIKRVAVYHRNVVHLDGNIAFCHVHERVRVSFKNIVGVVNRASQSVFAVVVALLVFR